MSEVKENVHFAELERLMQVIGDKFSGPLRGRTMISHVDHSCNYEGLFYESDIDGGDLVRAFDQLWTVDYRKESIMWRFEPDRIAARMEFLRLPGAGIEIKPMLPENCPFSVNFFVNGKRVQIAYIVDGTVKVFVQHAS